MIALILLVEVLGAVSALPGGIYDRSSHHNYLEKDTSLIVADVPLQCSVATDCWPDVVSEKLVSCFRNACLCLSCFTANVSSGGCQVLDCYQYSNGVCTDNRQSQLTAFLLSFFLSSVGAGNFYIGQWEIGVIQISLLVSFLLYCSCCCVVTIKTPEEVCSTWTGMCCLGCMINIMLMIAFSICCFWIVDLIYFGLNQRNSGNGCTLRPNLWS